MKAKTTAKKRKPTMSRKKMNEIKRGIMSAYPKGTRMFVIMPGDPIPDELKP